MASKWKDGDTLRLNPYLEWEAQTRDGSSSRVQDRWCSLYIRVKPGHENDYLPNLKRLLELAKDPNNAMHIWMSADELKNLDDVIKSGKILRNVNKVLVSFFIYRPESSIYNRGEYIPNNLFDVILAGPPIAGLTFDVHDLDTYRETAFAPRGDIDARGVAIGIIDDGIAFAHERFRDARGKTRVSAIWLQEIERRNGKDFGVAFGQRLNSEQIDEHLQKETEDELYRSIGLTDFYKNRRNPQASRASHGTHVLDLATGYDPALKTEKLRPILAVQLPSAAPVDTSGVTMESYVLQAVRQIMLWADRLGGKDAQGNTIYIPLIINFSFGISAGPKDGTHEVEQCLNELIAFRNETRASTCLVLPAGNSYRARTTAKMKLAAGDSESLDWIIHPDDSTPNFAEIWLDGQHAEHAPSPFEVTLTPPGGLSSDVSAPVKGKVRKLTVDDKAIAAVYYRVSKTKRGRVFIAVNQTASLEGRTDCAPAGRWRITLKNVSHHTATAHLYVQRDDTPFGRPRAGRQSYFDHEHAYGRDPETGAYDLLEKKCPITHLDTLSAIATSKSDTKDILVVGAADASKPFLPADYTASGPTKRRESPDCSAVTEEGRAHWGVLAAGTFSGSIVRMTGTSAAAPQLVRCIANTFAVQRTGGLPVDADISRCPPDEPPPGVMDHGGFVTAKGDEHRLGKFVLQRIPTRHIPRRRYPGDEPTSVNLAVVVQAD
jgi:hypothetical protein